MLQINIEQYEKAKEGNGGDLGAPTGVYMAGITDAFEDTTKSGKQVLMVVWDVIAGEYSGAYGDDWAAEHPFAHCIKLIIDNSCMWKLKRFLGKLEQSNPGFDANAWVANPDPKALVGMTIGIAWAITEFSSPHREVTEFYSTQEVMEGKVKQPTDWEKPKRAPVTYTAAAQPAQPVQQQQTAGYANAQRGGYYDPVPFGNPNIGR